MLITWNIHKANCVPLLWNTAGKQYLLPTGNRQVLSLRSQTSSKIDKIKGANSYCTLCAYLPVSYTLSKFGSILASLAKTLLSYLVLILPLLPGHLCGRKAWRWHFNNLTTPKRTLVNILEILLIQFNICSQRSLPQAYACVTQHKQGFTHAIQTFHWCNLQIVLYISEQVTFQW